MTQWDKPNGIANLDYFNNTLYSFGVNDKLTKKWQLIWLIILFIIFLIIEFR